MWEYYGQSHLHTLPSVSDRNCIQILIPRESDVPVPCSMFVFPCEECWQPECKKLCWNNYQCCGTWETVRLGMSCQNPIMDGGAEREREDCLARKYPQPACPPTQVTSSRTRETISVFRSLPSLPCPVLGLDCLTILRATTPAPPSRPQPSPHHSTTTVQFSPSMSGDATSDIISQHFSVHS